MKHRTTCAFLFLLATAVPSSGCTLAGAVVGPFVGAYSLIGAIMGPFVGMNKDMQFLSEDESDKSR